MEGKFIRRLTMLGLVSMFTLCAAVASADAQHLRPIKAKIPFAFSLGDKELAAGEYTFSPLSGFANNKTMLVSMGSSTPMFRSILEAQILTPKNKSTLVFHRYGEQYFLEQIWTAGERDGTQLPESRSERTIRRKLARTRQSNLSGKVMKVDSVEIVASLS